ncbi:MAG: arsenate reductase family [Burkholderiaceae bacterium]|jgi:Spx/MgsR family transcriptional regulator|nr:MAG: arsenate reductase family [Burkholderiaceae bacterium]
MITLYGIPNCDTVRRARAWLSGQEAPYRFHDFKKDGVPEPLLREWMQALGWEALVNRRGTTWRRLDAAQQAGAVDAAGALRMLREHPSLIRRPVVDWGTTVTVGFDPAAWAALRQRQG